MHPFDVIKLHLESVMAYGVLTKFTKYIGDVTLPYDSTGLNENTKYYENERSIS